MTSNLNPNAKEFIPRQPVHTYWDINDIEEVPSERYLPIENQQEQCDALNNLKKRSSFRRKFIAFAKKELCLEGGINMKKGCRINLNICGNFNGDTFIKGKKKDHIGFWFNYKQDGIIYHIVYECDDIHDPTTGWFFKWTFYD